MQNDGGERQKERQTARGGRQREETQNRVAENTGIGFWKGSLVCKTATQFQKQGKTLAHEATFCKSQSNKDYIK